VSGTADEAGATIERIREVGVDWNDVILALETEGVDKFKKSWTELVETVQGQMEKVTR